MTPCSGDRRTAGGSPSVVASWRRVAAEQKGCLALPRPPSLPRLCSPSGRWILGQHSIGN
jgi:hypothetical protein